MMDYDRPTWVSQTCATAQVEFQGESLCALLAACRPFRILQVSWDRYIRCCDETNALTLGYLGRRPVADGELG